MPVSISFNSATLKTKTARRFLNRNAFKLARLRVDKVKKHKLLTQEKKALKVLKKEVK